MVRSAAALGLLLLGCAGGDASWEVRGESEHFRYLVRPGESRPCAGRVEALEAHLAREQALLGVTPPPAPIAYHLYRDGQDLEASGRCPPPYIGCTHEGPPVRIDTTLPLHRHELIHAYVERQGGAHPLFAEGLAVVEGCRTMPATAPAVAWREAFAVAEDPSGDAGRVSAGEVYQAAGFFVRGLIDRFGEALVLQHHRQAPRTGTPEEMAAELSAFFAISFEEAWFDAIGRTYPGGPSLCDCSGRAVVAGAGEVALDASCDVPWFVAPGGPLSIDAVPSAGAGLHVRPCRGTPAAPDMPLQGTPHAVGVTILAPGEYYMDPAMSLSVAAAEHLSPSCPAVAPLVVGEAQGSVALAFPRAGTWYAALAFTAPASLALSSMGAPGVDVCAACDETSCVSLESLHPAGAGRGYSGTVVLRHRETGADGFDVITLHR